MGIKIVLRIAVGNNIDYKVYGSDTLGDAVPSKEDLIKVVSQMTTEAYEAYEKELEGKDGA